MSDHLKNPAPSQNWQEQDNRIPANDNQKHSWDTPLQYGSTMDRLTEQIGKSIAEKLNQRGASKKAIRQNMKPLNTEKKTTSRADINHGAKLQSKYQEKVPQPTTGNRPTPPVSEKGHGVKAQIPDKQGRQVVRAAQIMNRDVKAQEILNKYGAPEVQQKSQQQRSAPSPEKTQRANEILNKHGAAERNTQPQKAQEMDKGRSR